MVGSPSSANCEPSWSNPTDSSDLFVECTTEDRFAASDRNLGFGARHPSLMTQEPHPSSISTVDMRRLEEQPVYPPPVELARRESPISSTRVYRHISYPCTGQGDLAREQTDRLFYDPHHFQDLRTFAPPAHLPSPLATAFHGHEIIFNSSIGDKYPSRLGNGQCGVAGQCLQSTKSVGWPTSNTHDEAHQRPHPSPFFNARRH